MATRAEKVIDNFNRLCDAVWDNLPEGIAIDVSVYVRDRSQECRIDEATMDGEIRSRRISKGLMDYDIQTIKSMDDRWNNGHQSATED